MPGWKASKLTNDRLTFSCPILPVTGINFTSHLLTANLSLRKTDAKRAFPVDFPVQDRSWVYISLHLPVSCPTMQPSLLITHQCPPPGTPIPPPTALCFPADAALLFPSSEALEQQQPRYPVCSILIWKPPLTSMRGGLREFAVLSGGELTRKSSARGTGCWDRQPQRWHGTHTLLLLLYNVQKPGDSKCVKIAIIFFSKNNNSNFR